jgi:Zn-dependent metalloprotease
VLTAKLFPKAQFQDFANATVSAAGELYGIGGSRSVLQANWKGHKASNSERDS